MELCKDMPAGSFGEAYLAFMSDRSFHADDRPPVRFIDDPQLAYIATRAREVGRRRARRVAGRVCSCASMRAVKLPRWRRPPAGSGGA
jgi:hypothetical protein